MVTQADGIMPKEKESIALKFKCNKCGNMIAMLTNKFETLAEGKEELKKAAPVETDFEWTQEAKDRIQKVPFFVRGMAKKTVLSFARDRGIKVIDGALMDEVRDKVGM
jgi:hypothetical protein